jgi:hypothetical protein
VVLRPTHPGRISLPVSLRSLHCVKDLIHEGNVRRITIKQDGDTIAVFPLTFGSRPRLNIELMIE